MNATKSLYHGQRFPAVMISYAVDGHFSFGARRRTQVRNQRFVAGMPSPAIDWLGVLGRFGRNLAALGI